MERVTILQFRRDAEAVIRKVRQGKSLILTYRGQPVMRLEPMQTRVISKDDPLYKLPELAVPDGRSANEVSPNGVSPTNEEIDAIVYKV